MINGTWIIHITNMKQDKINIELFLWWLSYLESMLSVCCPAVSNACSVCGNDNSIYDSIIGVYIYSYAYSL